MRSCGQWLCPGWSCKYEFSLPGLLFPTAAKQEKNPNLLCFKKTKYFSRTGYLNCNGSACSNYQPSGCWLGTWDILKYCGITELYCLWFCITDQVSISSSTFLFQLCSWKNHITLKGCVRYESPCFKKYTSGVFWGGGVVASTQNNENGLH